MTGVTAWFARNRVAANLLMWLILLGGLTSFGLIRTQVVADLTYDVLTVTVDYPGAGPGEVDREICARIDESLRGLAPVRRVLTTAVEGRCHGRVELVERADARAALDDVEARIAAVRAFPEDAERPLVERFDPPSPVLGVLLAGRADRRTLHRLAERTRDEIRALPGITLATVSGVPPLEVSIEVSESVLRRHGLDLERVAEAVRRSSLDLPGGAVRARDAEVLLRADGQAHDADDFGAIVLLRREDGTRLTLGEVATITDGFAETAEGMRLDGEPAAMVTVYRVGTQDLGESAAQVHAYLDELRRRLPEGITATLWGDRSSWVEDRLGTLRANLRDGLLLVVLVLTLFLRARLALWVSAGIAVSFLGTLAAMLALDLAITMASLVGFLIAVGIVVDDALVVAENVDHHQKVGARSLEAAVRGVGEMAGPVFFSVLTTVAAFLPMLFLPGIMGQLFRVIGLVVILCLCFSLIESLLILPAHLAHLPPRTAPSTVASRPRLRWRNLRVGLRTFTERAASRYYLPLLRRALAWRAVTVAVAVALLALSLGLVAGGRLPFFFFQPFAGDRVVVGLTLPQGTPASATEAALRRIEEGVAELRRRLAEEGRAEDGRPEVWRHVLTEVGRLPESGLQFSDPARPEMTGSHLGGVTLELVPASQRDVSTREVADRLREIVGAVPDAVELSFGTAMLEAGKAIDVELTGDDLDGLRAAATELRAALARYPGVHGVADTLRAGKWELRLAVTPQAEALGIDLAELSRQVRQGFHGEEAQRLQRGRHELKVMIRYPLEERRLLSSLEAMRIRTRDGREMPLALAAERRLDRGFEAIARTDGRWSVRVSADVDHRRARAGDVIGDLRRAVLPRLAGARPGLTYTFAGEQQERRANLDALLRNTILTLFSIYGLLGLATRSYGRPLLIMGAIPFGAVGAIWGHWIMGFPLTIWSLIGMVALSGVVVNDSLVLVSRIDQARRAGSSLDEAVVQAGRARFRPILLTSITTFAGLMPLLFERSVQAQELIPIGISIAFGVVFATSITLVLVPVACHLLDDLRHRARGRWKAPGAAR